MSTSLAGVIVFYGLVALTIAGAAWVAFARNIVHSAFALLGTFLGVAGLYAYLSADLVAVIQLMVYVGGVLILILFAVMLTSRIVDVKVSNRSWGLLPGILILLAVGTLLVLVAVRVYWPRVPAAPAEPTASGIGDALLGPYVLPFEVISILLLAALVGAVTLARGRASRGSGFGIRGSGEPDSTPRPTPPPKPEARSPNPEPRAGDPEVSP
jgi:NAD(P)H-quinone oxidoreductase subunit 6